MTWNTKEFGARLKELRTNRGITQEVLAEELNVSWDHLARMERGNRKCSVELLMDISLYFSVSVDYLLFGKNPEQAENQKRLLGVIGELNEIVRTLR